MKKRGYIHALCGSLVLTLTSMAQSVFPVEPNQTFEATDAHTVKDGDAASTQPSSEKIERIIIVVGAGGEPAYEQDFRAAAAKWQAAAEGAQLSSLVIGLDELSSSEEIPSDRVRLLKALDRWRSIDPPADVWLILIGHGTTSRQASNFNLRGADVSSKDIQKALDEVNSRTIIAACFSTSGAWLPDLARANRIVVASTKSGAESNYSRFGQSFAESINDRTVDLDHDQEVSLLEAFLSASRKTNRFYEEANRLATEHAILDDNGDGKGTSVDFYDGLMPKSQKKADGPIDGEIARRLVLVPNEHSIALTEAQLVQRNQLEARVAELRQRKSSMNADTYYAELEKLFLLLSRLYLDQPAQIEQQK